MKRREFDAKQLWMMSADHEDWNTLIHTYVTHRNLENLIVGVLLYPKKGIGKRTLENSVSQWIQNQGCYAHGDLHITIVERITGTLGKCWAVIYQIQSWYNHFDLQEEVD